MRPQQVMQLFDLIFLGDVGKFLQEAFQIAATGNQGKSQKQRARVDYGPLQRKLGPEWMMGDRGPGQHGPMTGGPKSFGTTE